MHNYSCPDGWYLKTLGDMAKYINGRAFKPSDWSSFGLPIIRIEQISNSNAEYDHFNGEVTNDHLINNGDLLFSWSATLSASYGGTVCLGKNGPIDRENSAV